MPEPIPDTLENVAKALVSTLPKKGIEWDYLKAAKDTAEPRAGAARPSGLPVHARRRWRRSRVRMARPRIRRKREGGDFETAGGSGAVIVGAFAARVTAPAFPAMIGGPDGRPRSRR